jgi:hypothetical protein
MSTLSATGAKPIALPVLAFGLGALTAVSGTLHMVSVIQVAYSDRGGYDARLAELLWIGWTSLVCGLLMLFSCGALRRGLRIGYAVSCGAAAVFLVSATFLAIVDPGFWTAVPLYGGYLVAAAFARPARAPTRASEGPAPNRSADVR